MSYSAPHNWLIHFLSSVWHLRCCLPISTPKEGRPNFQKCWRILRKFYIDTKGLGEKDLDKTRVYSVKFSFFEHEWWRKLKGWTTVIVTNEAANSVTPKILAIVGIFGYRKYLSGENYLMVPSLPIGQSSLYQIQDLVQSPQNSASLLITYPSTLQCYHTTSTQ